MAEPKRVQHDRVVIGVLLAIFIVGLLATPVSILLGPVGHDVTNPEIRTSTLLPLLFWCLCFPAAVLKQPGCPMPVPLRVFWPLGCVLLLLHIAIAFHLGHGWSHETAWEHTRQIGGYGDGIFVNYAFALVWLVDAMWLAAVPTSYFARPRWLHWTIQGFLAFVIVNATLVFGSWPSRIAFLGFAVAFWFVLPRVRRWAARKSRGNAENHAATDIDRA